MGMNRSNRDLKGQTEVLDVGRQTVSCFLQLDMGTDFVVDTAVFKFIFDYLWVMKKDTTLLVRFLEKSLGLILLPNYAYK